MAGERAKLAEVLRAVTVPLIAPSGAEGTGFFVAPGVIVTCAHVITGAATGVAEVVRSIGTEHVGAMRFRVVPGTYHANDPAAADLVLLRAEQEAPAAHVLLHPAAEPGDPLWAFGYPAGRYRAGDSATLMLAGPSQRTEGAELLKTVHGPVGPGYSGGPVLNWRTGAVCGVVRYRDTERTDTARLIPVWSVFAAYPDLEPLHRAVSPGTRGWLELLDDEQIVTTGIRFPGPRLREYLEAAKAADDRHPHAELAGTEVTPPLWKVYLRQHTSRYGGSADDDPARVDADSLLATYPGVQILGGPGAGKSSLVRHLTAEIAKQWLRGEGGEFVPVPVPADALRGHRGLTELLARGVHSFDLDLDRGRLEELFAADPAPGARWLVLADGLDEIVDPSDRRVVAKLVQRLRRRGRFGFLLTTRPTGADYHTELSENDRYPTFVIEPFARHQLGEFAKAWFEALEVPDADAESARFVVRADEAGLRDLATIPLIATMMCVLYAQEPGRRLPSNRVDLYRQFVELLLDKRRATARKLLREWGGRSGAKAEHAVDELFDNALPVLREWAYAHYENAAAAFPTGRPVPTLVEVASRHVPRPPDTVPEAEWTKIVHEVFLATSLLIGRRGGPEFLHQTILEYLAAEHLVRRHPRPGRRWLPPRLQDWKNWEVELFLVGLWAAGGKDVTRVLTRMLRRRHWKHNHGFVADVIRQGLPVPDKVRDRLRRGLIEQVAHPQTLDDWREAVAELAHLDAGAAEDNLEALLREETESVARFEALRLLLDLDRSRGITAANYLVFSGRPDAEERLRVAKIVLEADRPHGLRTLIQLAAAPELRGLRLEAAQLVFAEDPERGRETLRRLVEDPGCPDPARLAAAEAICARDPGEVPATLALLSRDRTVGFETRCGAAVAARHRQRALGADLLAELAEDPRHPPAARRRAARALGDTDLRAVEILRGLALAAQGDPEERFDAASALAEVDPGAGLDVLSALARDPRLDAWQVDAAKIAAQYPGTRDRALDRLTELAGDAEAEFAIRRFAAHALHELDPVRGIDALVELATGPGASDDRMSAITDLADGRDEERAAGLLRAIVESRAESVRMRGKAAAELASLEPGLAASAYATLAQDSDLPIRRRADYAVKVTQIDRAEGIALLRQVAAAAPGEQALDVIERLEQLDRLAARAAYQRVAVSPGVGHRTRLAATNRAARLSPEPSAKSRSEAPERGGGSDDDVLRLGKKRQLQVRVARAGDRKLKPEERFAAAEAAAKLDREEGRNVLQALIDDRKTPKAVRMKAEKAMKRLR
ncbi:trypsin-like peptidase domain-containing protein [Amycolatopsis australiensis]|uniref:NACHT domain-containing protein n=1 Tax=Amycolatopsis australiensis TaxID=546364 RepID=A0A1K1RWI9_9PSEU|nr:trypsin-like peptidase domain-containing protein [Amycolatopsis australiensis]SFW76298.1 NACHT domain-containing protein [Amycolatopsis australiensis]